MLKPGQCYFILDVTKYPNDDAYCRQRTRKYKEKDDDENTHFKFQAFCPTHTVVARRQEIDEEDEYSDEGVPGYNRDEDRNS